MWLHRDADFVEWVASLWSKIFTWWSSCPACLLSLLLTTKSKHWRRLTNTWQMFKDKHLNESREETAEILSLINYCKTTKMLLLKLHLLSLGSKTIDVLSAYEIVVVNVLANSSPLTSRHEATLAFIWSHVSGHLDNASLMFSLLSRSLAAKCCTMFTSWSFTLPVCHLLLGKWQFCGATTCTLDVVILSLVYIFSAALKLKK